MQEQNENISALMDGELDSEENIQVVITQMQLDDKMRRRWEHYHLIGDAMKKNLPNSFSRNLATQVSQALKDIPPLSVPVYPQPASFQFKYKSMSGFALAASAGVIAFLGVGALEPQPAGQQQSQFLSGVSVLPIQTTPKQSTQPPPFSISQSQTVKGAHWDVAHPGVESKLNDYLANHEFSATSSSIQRGLPPYVRIIGYEPDKAQ